MSEAYLVETWLLEKLNDDGWIRRSEKEGLLQAVLDGLAATPEAGGVEVWGKTSAWEVLWAGGYWWAGTIERPRRAGKIFKLPGWAALARLYPDYGELLGERQDEGSFFPHGPSGRGVFWHGGLFWRAVRSERVRVFEIKKLRQPRWGNRPLRVDAVAEQMVSDLLARYDLVVAEEPALWSLKGVFPMWKARGLLQAGARGVVLKGRGFYMEDREPGPFKLKRERIPPRPAQELKTRVKSLIRDIKVAQQDLEDLHIVYRGDLGVFEEIPHTVISQASPYGGEGLQVWISGGPMEEVGSLIRLRPFHGDWREESGYRARTKLEVVISEEDEVYWGETHDVLSALERI